MITFQSDEFDVNIHPEKIAFLSKEPLQPNYIVCLTNGVGFPCVGWPTYDEMITELVASGFHVRFKTPTGLDTCVNRDFLFLTSVDVTQTSIVFPGATGTLGAVCVVASCLDTVQEMFAA